MSCCSEYNCPVDTTLKMIGGKYKSLILWHLIGSTLRFGELRKLIPQATPKMLTQQLRELEENNLISRTVYPVVPPKVEYSLTDLGRSIRPILSAMYAWGNEYLVNNGIEANCSMTVIESSNNNIKHSE
ncbi:HxlR family transcriptional regulator [Lachnotalea glycerini]|uniref:HxlR family transcriptional regulator n=1 Tax=Lachnotalea glycerini TaxID=1763509 RepID=A0A318ERT7_9FIRM|nr:helix-turn-helix domain-containing protein [Lachnotalea glycerini]OYP01244.1 transcriptional regulator [Lachnotalea glycerini]PXV91059.1 HxlR family transcriptional regulator [Lachnotalea glycerini]